MKLEDLAPDIQRQIIDHCIQERILKMNYEGTVYTLPTLIQLTYFCKNCGQSYAVRIFSNSILSNDFRASKKKCPECWKPSMKNKEDAIMYVAHKTVPIDYNVFIGGKQPKNIASFLDD